jgi:quinol monooxygenase YgiN
MKVLFVASVAAALCAAAAGGVMAQAPTMQAPGAQANAQSAYLVTYIEVTPSATDKAIGLMRALAAASRKEAGNQRFEILQQVERPAQLGILEAWSDGKAAEAHGGGAAAKAFRSQIDPLRVGYYDERLETGIDLGAPAAPGKDAVYVATHVDVTGQFKDDAIEMMKKLAAASRKEPGSVRFEIWQQNNRLNHFTMVEVWKDAAALDAHNAAPAARGFRDEVGHMMGALYDDRRYRNVETP